MYKTALKNQYLYRTKRGSITTQDLFDLPLSGNNGFNLDQVAKDIDADITQDKRPSFVEPTQENPTNANKLKIVKDIIKDKLDAKDALKVKAANAAKREQILRLLAAKQDDALAAKSEAELLKELEEIT